MKTWWSTLNLILFGLLAGLVLSIWQQPHPATVLAAPGNEESCDSGRSVQVSGAAVINVVPDRVLLQLGVQTNGTNPESVQVANEQEIQRVIRAVLALGVESKDIATDYYLVYPIYDDYNSLFIKGYRIDNTISITLRDVHLVEDVLVAALRSGANEVQDIQFYTSELRAYRDQARQLAMQAAQEKAQLLADAAGAQAGCILTISENSWTSYYGSWRGGREMALWAQNVVQNSNVSSGSLSQEADAPINLGMIAVRAEVAATYSMK